MDMNLNELTVWIEEYIDVLSEDNFTKYSTEEDIKALLDHSEYIRDYCASEDLLHDIDELQEEIISLPKCWKTNEDAIKEYQENPNFYKYKDVETMVLVDNVNNNILSKSYQNIKELLVGPETAYNKARCEYENSINNLIKGYEGEKKLVDGIKMSLATSKQIFLENVNINNNEHDLIIVSKKGIFTIEIKNHNTAMRWEANGTFLEGRMNKKTGRINYKEIDPMNDPYMQALQHRNSLYEALKPVGDFEIQQYVVLCTWLEEPTAEDKTILKRVKLLNAFIEEYRKYPDILTEDQVNSIYQYIDANKVKDKKFPLPDIAKINQITADFIASHNIRYQDISISKYQFVYGAIERDSATNQIALFNKIKNYKLNLDKSKSYSFSLFNIACYLGVKFKFFSWPLVLFVIEGIVIGYAYGNYILSLGTFLLIWISIVLFINNGREYFREIAGYSTADSYNNLSNSMKTTEMLRYLGILTKEQKEEDKEVKDIIDNFVCKYLESYNTYVKFNDIVNKYDLWQKYVI